MAELRGGFRFECTVADVSIAQADAALKALRNVCDLYEIGNFICEFSTKDSIEIPDPPAVTVRPALRSIEPQPSMDMHE